MTLGVLMLCHTALDRAAQVARHWAEQGCPVVIHVDRRVRPAAFKRLEQALRDLPDVRFSERFACDWGSWGLVAATQAAAQVLLRDFPRVSHVYLASGACIPLRPIGELTAYLAARPGTDFIESVTTHDVGWTVGGLNIERFELWFPVSWRKRRWLFDRLVGLQRRLRIRRRIPTGLVPHLGSQWWCLTRETLSAILDHPRRPQFDRYFRRVWIPDEAYFQTLARLVSKRIESRSLTLHKFDFQGKPHVFYDDHLQLLRRSECFVARKIWPQADSLYRSFLTPAPVRDIPVEPNPGRIDRLFAKATERRLRGRPGLYMQSRFPNADWESQRTAAPYSMFSGFADVFENFETWLGKIAGLRVHGHLYAPARAEFAGGETIYNGCLTDNARARDYDPRAFLTSLIWNTRGERQCFQFGPDDRQEIAGFIAADPHAQISVITGAWAIGLFRSEVGFDHIRREAARLQRIESEFLKMLQSPWVKARVRTWTLTEFLEDPMEYLQTVVDELRPRSLRLLTEAPRPVDLQGFGAFLKRLRDQGMPPTLIGDYAMAGDQTATPARQARPHLVK